MRRCGKCNWPLTGKKGHGFPTKYGQAVYCSDCAFTNEKKERERRPRR